jgi:REP element-mobilizing transposase RayT
MANTYLQIYIHIVFAVRWRKNLVPEKHREEIQQYITGIVQKRKNKLIAIYCMPDHTHLLIGLHPETSLFALMRDVKACSSKFINEKKWLPQKFNWQNGYGAFSYSHSQLGRVANYIHNQKEHHKKKSFQKEYIQILEKFEAKYDKRYLFDWDDEHKQS